MKAAFRRFAEYVAVAVGKPAAFFAGVGIIAMWAISGPLFGFSEQWQLMINSFTTIVTFLIVFLIQNTQNRDFAALQLKIDALLLASDSPARSLASLHNLTDEELARLENALTKARGRHNIDEIIEFLESESVSK